MLREGLAGHAIGVEFSNAGAARARRVAEEFDLPTGPRMEILQGDAMQMLDEVRTQLMRLQRRGFDTAVLLLLGVLHELPTRSHDFSFHQLVGTVCGTLPHAVIGLNEPCAIQGWEERERVIVNFGNTPRNVILAHAGLAASTLAGCRIDASLADPAALRPLRPAQSIGTSGLEIDVGHFAEMLQKARNDSAARIKYELGERTAWLGPDVIAGTLASVHGFETEVLLRASSGTRATWSNLALRAVDRSGRNLSVPYTHFSLVGSRLPSPT